ncbi:MULTISPECIES: ATP-dependent Clp protease proteolytic subunit [unclassified Pseudofrankia]|uniref:ATP-dependent Clp protease proteolytic subunit n=1 Tax=unclassified Pseudofrankia TaxID=2994372 RepID=UPI00289C5677|nr:ATP-dependent Clp protease proteolytic subunit [Pseudofrankia sp. BMG5.37]
MTRWTRTLLDDALSLYEARRYRSALQRLLIIFDVYPGQPEARMLASEVVRAGTRRTADASPDEVLERPHLMDSRLSPIFCFCDAPGCQVTWVSAHHSRDAWRTLVIANPLGAGCKKCGETLCRTHVPTGPTGILRGCLRCGGEMDSAPRPNGRRDEVQTPRLNLPLVHVGVLVEGREPPSPEFMSGLFEETVPEVFEEDPQITGANRRRFWGDGSDLGLALAGELSAACPARTQVRVYPGRQAEPRGQRWVVIKIFEDRPKHVDPDNPATTTSTPPSDATPTEPSAESPLPNRTPEQTDPLWPEQEARLLRERIIVVGAVLEDDRADQICAQLLLLEAQDPNRDIFLYLNSPGGKVGAGMAIYDTMQFIQADVVTVGMGLVAGIAQLLLCAGATGKRYALPHARIMTRPPTAGRNADRSDVATEDEQLAFVKVMISERLAHHTGQPKDRIDRDFDRERWYTADEAKDYGMVDQVVAGPHTIPR